MNFLTLLVISLLNPESIKIPKTHFEPLPVFPKNDFRSPLDIPILLSGNFGEPRKAHFHTGLDMRTNEKEGLQIYAVGDGYVSRIGVAPGGYGNVLYITHPNGYTSVYGHLQKFQGKIATKVRAEQYAQQSFQIDITLPENEILVKKGEPVALSGNSGGSGGPHLHFEIRDAQERPINPMHFGFIPADNLAPSVGFIKIYPRSIFKNNLEGWRLPTIKQGNEFKVSASEISVNDPKVGIGVNTFDRMNNTTNSYGIYKLKLFDKGILLYEYSMDRISFDYKRSIQSQCDYPVFLTEGSRNLHKCFVEPNNPLPCYPTLLQDGEIDLSDKKIHAITIESQDFKGNTTTIKLDLKWDETVSVFKKPPTNFDFNLKYTEENNLQKPNLEMNIPAKCLFDDLHINYSHQTEIEAGTLSEVHTVGKSTDHLADFYDVKIKPSNPILLNNEKAVIIWKDEKHATAAKGGKWEGEFLATKTRELGSYSIKLDTTPPVITPLNISPNKNMQIAKTILLKVADNLSGIQTYNAFIDGKWELMEFDAKFALMRIPLSHIASGKHVLEVKITDERKNEKEYKVDFYN